MESHNTFHYMGSRRAGLQNMLIQLTRKYWFDALLLLLAFYVFQIKGSIQVTFGPELAAQSQASLIDWSAQTVAHRDEAPAKLAETSVSDLETKPGTPEPIAEKVAAKHLALETAQEAAQNLANNFNNLSFILDPSMAERRDVPAEVVKLKRDKCLQYVQMFARVAQEEKRKYGIPASITLAQGLLESNAGDSRLTRHNNNHFGIKCFSKKCKKGHCSNFTDDTHKDFFRKYPDGVDSYREHSRFLQQSRYAGLRKFSSLDYKNWALGLKKAGYATDPKYAQKLIKIIEVLKLHRYDEEG